MTLIHAVSPRTGSVRRPGGGPIQGPRYDRDGLARSGLASSGRPVPSRPSGAPTRYRGTGVAMSVAPHHRRRPVPFATTVGLALLVGVITLWLGLVAHFAQLANDDAGSSAHVPDRLAVVRVEAGESLQDVAARVAPEAPVRQVAQRIRELNDLNSTALVAGQTLIAPVG
jgi:LysM domain